MDRPTRQPERPAVDRNATIETILDLLGHPGDRRERGRANLAALSDEALGTYGSRAFTNAISTTWALIRVCLSPSQRSSVQES
jgi:hypothetical protein